jgi:hypothetical protein
MVVFNKTPVWWVFLVSVPGCLAAKAVQRAALTLEGVDHIEGSQRLAAHMPSVCHGITDHVLQEDLEDAMGLLVDEALQHKPTTLSRGDECQVIQTVFFQHLTHTSMQ